MYSFPNLEPVPCLVLTVTSWPAYRFLRGQVRWSGTPISWSIFHSLFWSTQSKGFSVANEAEVDIFGGFYCFFYDPMVVGNLISGSSAFLNPAWTSVSSRFMYCWSLAWRMNKVCGGDGIPVELFQILKDDAVKVLHSIYQQIWRTQQWPQDWKRSFFIPIPKKGNAKEYSNYCTMALISHASNVMLNIF